MGRKWNNKKKKRAEARANASKVEVRLMSFENGFHFLILLWQFAILGINY